MDYGVTITRGAAPWQIFQQGPDGTACIRLEGKYHLVHLSQELPLQFSAVPHAKTTVKARVALESTGESVVPWTECTRGRCVRHRGAEQCGGPRKKPGSGRP